MDAVKMDAAGKLGMPTRTDTDGMSRATLAGGLLAGILASACCVGPLVRFTRRP